MGIVAKQAVSNARYIFLGVLFGAVNTIFILPRAFEDFKAGWGFIGLILSIGIISTQLFSFSSHAILVNRIPKILNPREERNLVSVVSLSSLIGIVLFGLSYFLGKDILISWLSDNNKPLMEEYYPVAFILTLSLILVNLFNGFLTAKYKTVLVTAIQDPFLKLSYLCIATLYLFKLISFSHFVWLFIVSYILAAIILFISAAKNGFKLGNASKVEQAKELVSYGAYSILDKGAAVIIQRLDILMIAFILNLDTVAEYTLAFFIGSVVYIPYKSISNIANPIASKEIGSGDFKNLESVYQKSTLFALLLGGFVFIGVWINVDNLLLLLPEKFRGGLWVIFFIGISKLIQVTSGISGAYIVYSKYYKYNLFLNVSLVIVTVLSNLFLIVKYGINGAAAATALTVLIYSAMKVEFVYRKFRTHPFTGSLFRLILLIIVSCVVFEMFRDLGFSPIVEIMIKSIIFTVFYYLGLRWLKIIPELSSISKLRDLILGK